MPLPMPKAPSKPQAPAPPKPFFDRQQGGYADPKMMIYEAGKANNFFKVRGKDYTPEEMKAILKKRLPGEKFNRTTGLRALQQLEKEDKGNENNPERLALEKTLELYKHKDY